MSPIRTTCALTVALILPTLAYAQDLTSICYARGSEADGISGFTHHVDGRAVRVDSPNQSEERTRITRWQDAEFAAAFHAALMPGWDAIPTDLLEQCDDGWRDTIVLRFADGSTDSRHGSCIRNPVAQALDGIFATLASTVDAPDRSYIDGAAPGVYAPCEQDW